MEGFQEPEWQEQENASNDEAASDVSPSGDAAACEDDAAKDAPENLNDEKADGDVARESADGPECEAKEEPGDNSQDDSEDDSLALLNELNGKMDQMIQLFTQKIQHTAHEEKIVDQMHAELKKYKDDMYAQLVRPILLDIIEIRESIRRVSSNFAAKPEGERVVPLKTFSDYTYDIQDVLEKNNIVIYDSKEGDAFNALKHRAIKKVTTPVEELHGKIAESLSSGYEYLGKPISPEKVVVYVYQKPENTEGEN